MVILLFALLGLACGAIGTLMANQQSRRRVAALQQRLEESSAKLRDSWQKLKTKHEASTELHLRQRKELEVQEARLAERIKRFESSAVTFEELSNENGILKRDLQNVELQARKLALDRDAQQETQEFLDNRARELSSRYLKETIKWVSDKLTANNYASCKQRLLDVISWCRKIGFIITADDEHKYVNDLKADYEMEVRAALEREEQARIRARIKEEQIREREIERAKQQADRERMIIEVALQKALSEAQDQHSAEIEELRRQLQEAEERQRAISQAQITKAGHVYVISNIGSFGHGVFKIGLTRRLEPNDRVRELSGAAVPFPFDVHMMISSENAPALEFELHKKFHKFRLNKANPRKEYFKVDLEEIRQVVVQNHGEITYKADAEALQYNQSLQMSDEDQEFIESVYETGDDEENDWIRDEIS